MVVDKEMAQEITKNSIQYKKVRHLWESTAPAVYETGIYGYSAVSEFVSIDTNGRLFLRHKYAIDGITGVTGWPWERLLARKWLRSACWPHDGLYQLIRLGLLPRSLKDRTDEVFYNFCIRGGAWQWQAEAAYQMVYKFGSAENEASPVFAAP